ncbi:hypothetical protein J6590_035080 [Homalodisca vitripennis]|nr:hypothetical protein J6590_035080 [Homalodisca vitripennis]
MKKALFGRRWTILFCNEHATEKFSLQQSSTTSRRPLTITFYHLRGDIGWLPRALDLTSCHLFLWRNLNSNVFLNLPRTVDALKEAITNEAAAILPEMTRRVLDTFREI